MFDKAPSRSPVQVRDLEERDLERVVRIDALHTGAAKPDYWAGVFEDLVVPGGPPPQIALAAEDGEVLVGYLLGEVRAFEFGSEPCGWIFSIGVVPVYLRRGVATKLLAEACRRFRRAGVRRVRTMVQRRNVPVLSLFRSNGFMAGTFVQLELDLEEHA